MDPKTGLYSKAAEIIRQFPQERATPQEMLAFAKARGAKPTELSYIPAHPSDRVTRDEMARHVELNSPRVSVVQYGEGPNTMSPTESRRFSLLQTRHLTGNGGGPLNDEEMREYTSLLRRIRAKPSAEETPEGDDIQEPGYADYVTPGGDDYRERLLKLRRRPGDTTPKYRSSHWRDHPDVLAHIRMQDRVEPDGKRLLHVEEVQSDWGQDARKKGIETGAEDKAYHDFIAQLGERARADGLDPSMGHWGFAKHYGVIDEMDRLANERVTAAQKQRVPQGPYIGNTQHWTDLALKNVLQEAAVGQYDGVIFTPGAAQAKRYEGMEHPEGLQSYYDNILPKSVMKLARAHDPAIQPGEPVQIESEQGGTHDAFHLPITDDLRQGILDKGFPSFKTGGAVKRAEGGRTDEGSSQAPAAPGGLPDEGGVRGGAGLLQAPDEAPLEGLPASVRIPATGQTVATGPDARIRGVARSYMAEAGMPYQPPTKYAKVDPARAARIGQAYEEMRDDPTDPLTKASYDAMIRETMAQYNAAKRAGLKIEFWHPSRMEDPYGASPRLATEDIRKNHHMWVFPTYAGYGSQGDISEEDARRNPLLQLTGETWNGIPVTVNDVFRAVHDYFGHAKEGVGFRADGEENAWRSHASMYSPLARMAMTSETRGQNSWLNFGPHGEKNRNARTEDTVFAPQKIGILPHWAHHEGAEDFMRPEDIAEMSRIRSRHDPKIGAALDLTRRFTKDGRAAILNLKS